MATQKLCNAQTSIPEWMHEKFKTAAKQRGLTKSSLIKLLIIEYLEKHSTQVSQ
jgi:metal-responsive CopG/Arc/MetJ family transcriptional regulator